MSCLSRLFINEDNDIVLDGLKLSHAGTYVNDATVTMQVTDASGIVVIASAAMSYVSASDGQYRGVIDQGDAAQLTDGATYYVECSIESGEFDGFRRLDVKATYHGSV